MISLNNELTLTYRARHPHDPSVNSPWVLTYGFEYLQSISVPFSCFYHHRTLVLIRTVVVVVVVVANINFLTVAERNKLLILPAVQAILAVIYT